MSNRQIDRGYETAMCNGALGGKLIGAGGGGFLMFYTENKRRLLHAMLEEGLEEVRFRFDFEGSKTMTNDADAANRGSRRGLATRMRPLTEQLPKALLEVAGEPFITHQLRLLARQGIRDVKLLVGYRWEQIARFCRGWREFRRASGLHSGRAGVSRDLLR
jgi:hypothetical protein